MSDDVPRHENPAAGLFRFVFIALEIWLGLMALILATAFVLGLLGANSAAPFAAWIYARANELMAPFRGMFEPISLSGATEIQPSLLFAILVYGVVAAVAGKLADLFQ